MSRKVAWGVLVFVCGTVSVFGQIGAKTIALRCGSLLDGRGDSLQKNVLILIEGRGSSAWGRTRPTWLWRSISRVIPVCLG